MIQKIMWKIAYLLKKPEEYRLYLLAKLDRWLKLNR